MRFIATFFAVFVCFSGYSNAQCTLSTPDSPRLVNLRLGMSPEEVNTALNGAAKVKVKKNGQYSYFKSYLKKGKAKGILNGARAFFIRFFDKRVYQVEIFYHKDHRWNDLETLIQDFSSESGFRSEHWQTKNGYAKAECDAFVLKADYVLNPHLEITDKVLEEEVRLSKKNKDSDDGN